MNTSSRPESPYLDLSSGKEEPEGLSGPWRPEKPFLGSPFSFQELFSSVPPGGFVLRAKLYALRIFLRLSSFWHRDRAEHMFWLAGKAIRSFVSEAFCTRPSVPGPTATFGLIARESARLWAIAGVNADSSFWSVARCSRDLLALLDALWREAAEFGVVLDRPLREMTERLASAVEETRLFLAQGGRRSLAARGRLEKARGEIGIFRALHRASLESILSEPNAVSAMKIREIYRHLARAAECLADTFPFVDGSSVVPWVVPGKSDGDRSGSSDVSSSSGSLRKKGSTSA